MTDKEKLIKIKKLADAMYYAAQYLTTDASRLHKAMDEYHNFTIHECKEEPIPWLTPDQAREAVEIAREEIFEKMKFYIKSMVSDITFSDVDGNDNYDLNKFIEDLKQAMKDE